MLIDRAFDDYLDSKRQINNAYNSTEIDREKLMVEKMAKQIKKLGEKASFTIVVGDNHLSRVSERLKQKYPKKPIVSCKIRS